MDELSAWVEMPLSGEVDCLDIENKRIVADETIRQMIPLALANYHVLVDFPTQSSIS